MRRSGTVFICFLVFLLAAPHRIAAQVGVDGFYSEPVLVPAIGMHTAAINQMDTDAAGQFLVTGSDDKSVGVWSRESGRLLRFIRVAAGPGFIGRIFAVALAPDGSMIAAGGYTDPGPSAFHIYIFDRASGQQIGLIGGLSGVANQLAFSPDGKRLAAVLGGANGVRLYDVHTAQQIAADTDYGDSSHAVAFDRNGNLVTTSFDGKIRLYSSDLRRLQVVDAPGGAQPFAVAFRSDGRSLALGYSGTLRVDLLDATTLRWLQSADTSGLTSGDLSRVAWSADGTRLFAAGRLQRDRRLLVRAWTDSGRHVLADYKVAENSITNLRSFADGTLAVAAGDPRLTLLKPDGTMQWAVEPQMADYREQTQIFAVAEDATRVRFDYNTTRPALAEFSLRDRQLDIDPPADPTMHTASVDGLPVVWRNTKTPTLAGRAISLDPRETSRSISVTTTGDDFVLGAEWSLSRFSRDGTLRWRVQTPGVAWAVNIAAEERVVVAGYSDGTIRWHRLSDGVEILAFFSHPDKKRWVVWTPLGQYIASPGGEQLIQWQINHGSERAPEVFSAARFRDRFYRPDVIERVLAVLDPARALAAADRQLGRATVTTSIIADTPPRVAIIDPAENTFVDRGQLAVAYVVEDRAGTAIHRVRLMLDGRLVATEGEFLVPAAGRLSRELRAPLDGPGHVLSIIVESDKGSSDPATVHIRRPEMPFSNKPDLYVLAVGVTRFQSSMVPPLNFSGRDATEFAAQMKLQEGGLYRQALVLTLRDGDATNEAVLKGLAWLKKDMRRNDVAVIFFATHGQNNADGKFFLLPYDARPDDEVRLLRTGVRDSDLREALGKLAERGKTVLFLDACYSGNILGGAEAGPTDVDKVAADLASPENGVIVFSSSTGRQFSLEKPELGHGVFTYALLEALKGNAPRKQPPWIYVSDLKDWLQNRVNMLTKGVQTPRILENQQQDDERIFISTGSASASARPSPIESANR